jgi:hypothetical protein
LPEVYTTRIIWIWEVEPMVKAVSRDRFGPAGAILGNFAFAAKLPWVA